jgi:flagellar biosynthetic protein FliR
MVDSLSINILSGKFIIGMLMFIRIMGLMVSGPFWSNPGIIPQLKMFLAVIFAVFLTEPFWKDQPVIDFHLWNMVLLSLKEFMVGVAIGFSARMAFWGARFAGGIIDFDMGYQTSTLFVQGETPTLVGEMKSLAILMVFLIVNGHHFILQALWASVQAVPLTTFTITDSTIELLIKITLSVFLIGIKMAAPVLVALFLVNLSLALLARVAPQTNIFIMSFQVKIVVGLLVLMASVPLFVFISKFALEQMETEVMKVILSLNPARV